MKKISNGCFVFSPGLHQNALWRARAEYSRVAKLPIKFTSSGSMAVEIQGLVVNRIDILLKRYEEVRENTI